MNNNGMNNNGMNNGQVQMTFAAVPVLQTYVPEAVVTTMKGKYGSNIYDITMVKRTADQFGYVVRVQENGTYRSEVVNDQGNIMQ